MDGFLLEYQAGQESWSNSSFDRLVSEAVDYLDIYYDEGKSLTLPVFAKRVYDLMVKVPEYQPKRPRTRNFRHLAREFELLMRRYY